jgi:hypothetical protein
MMAAKTRIAVFVLVAVGLLILLPGTNTFIQRGGFGTLARHVAQFLLPKPDLYEPLLEKPVLLGDPNHSYHCSFRHKYAGIHTFGLNVRDLPYPSPIGREDKVSASGDCRVDDAVIFQFEVDRVLYSWWSDPIDGLALFQYSVPEDMPLDTPIECIVSLDQATADVLAGVGAYALYAQKRSEE